MDASYYRSRAEHVRRLADVMGQKELSDTLRGIAQDYDEIAEAIEGGSGASAQAKLRQATSG